MFKSERAESPESGVKAQMFLQLLMFKLDRAESPDSGAKSPMFLQ